MADTKKISVSLLAPVADEARAVADSDYGGNLSAFLGDLVEREVRRRRGLDAVHEWEAENGAITAAEQAEIRGLWPA